MHATRKAYLPAAGKDWLLPLYDPLTKLLGVEAFHRRLINQATISLGHRVLEIGCGTGTLAILIKRLNPAAQVVGIDPDPKALERARRKAQRHGNAIQFDQGFSEELPYPTPRSIESFPHSCSTMSNQKRNPLPCGRPLGSSNREAYCTWLISTKGNASPAVSMDSSRASFIRAMARAPTTASSLSCSMPDS
jgi:SAM-dependent methyltransferase